jgi:radical SAM superfamily enzyme YgiQ (UPF0313 family)
MRNAADCNSHTKVQLRIALVYPPFDDKRDRSAYYVVPPLGLLYLASYLERETYSVSLFDFIYQLKTGELPSGGNIYAACAERISASKPDVVCFSTQCTTSPGSVNIARRLKALVPDVRIVFGGHDVSFVAREYMKAFPEIDFVLIGEAEVTIVPLMRAIHRRGDFHSIPGLVWRTTSNSIKSNGHSPRVSKLDDLLPPAYHLVNPLDDYFSLSRSPTVLIDSGRGCAFECEFCQTTLLNGHKIRYRSVDSLLAELTDLRNRFGKFEAYFVHDLFTAKRSFVEDLCTKLLDANLGLTWQCRCRLDQVDRDLLNLMARAGCRMLLYGVESGSPETLKRMNKKYRTPLPDEIVERVRWTIEAGIFPSLSMVVGTPEESLADLSATMELAHRFLKLGSVNAFIQLMSPLPGTKLAERLQHRFTYRGQVAPTAFSQGIEFSGGSRLSEDEDLIKSHPKIFQSFQVVVPDHGDIDLCIDVSLVYCKLMEIYQRTFGALLELTTESHLQLFTRWRSFWLAELNVKNLAGVRDYEIWSCFERFVEMQCERGDVPHALLETYRFEKCLRAVSEDTPVLPPSAEVELPFFVAPQCHLFETDVIIDGVPQQMADLQRFLIFASRDRLHVIPICSDQLELLSIACDRNLVKRISPEAAARLKTRFSDLGALGALVADDDSARVLESIKSIAAE